jgi:hypothetical protein
MIFDFGEGWLRVFACEVAIINRGSFMVMGRSGGFGW